MLTEDMLFLDNRELAGAIVLAGAVRHVLLDEIARRQQNAFWLTVLAVYRRARGLSLTIRWTSLATFDLLNCRGYKMDPLGVWLVSKRIVKTLSIAIVEYNWVHIAHAIIFFLLYYFVEGHD